MTTFNEDTGGGKQWNEADRFVGLGKKETISVMVVTCIIVSKKKMFKDIF